MYGHHKFLKYFITFVLWLGSQTCYPMYDIVFTGLFLNVSGTCRSLKKEATDVLVLEQNS